jgi:hypothetical protein
MKLRGGLLFLLYTYCFSVLAAGELNITGGRAAAMGYACVAASDPWSVINNQAGLAWRRQFSIGVYMENRFLVKELSLKTMGAVLPVKHGAFGISLGHFGFSIYSETKAGLAFALSFGKHFSAGIQIDYLLLQQGPDYGNRNLFTCEAGLQYRPNDLICLGVHVYNPVPVRVAGFQEERLPTLFRMGLSWKLSDDFIALVDYEKDLVSGSVLRTGLEYHCVKPLYIRIGFLSSPMQFTFGIGLELGHFGFDFASSYHTVLGYSPQGSLVYHFN